MLTPIGLGQSLSKAPEYCSSREILNNKKAPRHEAGEPSAIQIRIRYFFFFALVPLAFLAGFLVPHGLRLPQPFPANLLTSHRGKAGCGFKSAQLNNGWRPNSVLIIGVLNSICQEEFPHRGRNQG
jgi:hypothetical protein